MMNLGDDTAHVTQYTAYLPYGELLVDEHTSSEAKPWTIEEQKIAIEKYYEELVKWTAE